MRQHKHADESVDHLLRPAAVKAGHPELRRGVGDERKFGAREKDRPGAADDLAEGIEQRFQQVHCAAGRSFVGKLRRRKNLQILRHQPGAEQTTRQPSDRVRVAVRDLRHFRNAPAKLPERGDVLVVCSDDFGGLLLGEDAQVLKTTDDVERRQFVASKQGGIVQRLPPTTLRVAHDGSEQSARDQGMRGKI